VSSFVVVHQGADEPTVIVHVDLVDTDGLVRLTSNLVDVRPDDVAVGMVVEVWFDDVEPGTSLPLFRPATLTRS
jgi:uncharacterized OB-fold protein